MQNSQQDFTNITSQQTPPKNHSLVKIRKYMRSTGSPASSTEENHPAKQLANYKLPNSYAFFDTVHVKTSATMLTVFYMLSLAIADLIVYTAMISSSSFTYVSAINAVILLSISLALYGIWKELSLCMLPLMVIQVLLGAMMILILIFSNFIEFHCFLSEICPGGRFLLLAMGSATFCVLHCYCIIIIWLCWKFFRYLEKKTKLERTWHIETIDDEIDENILIHNMSFKANFTQC